LPERINKLLLTQTDKSNVKQIQQLKTTPLSKIKLMQPSLSVNRLQTPSNTQNLLNVRLTKFYLFLTCTTYLHAL